MSSQTRKSRKRTRSRKRKHSSSKQRKSVSRSASRQRAYTSHLCNLIFPVPRVKQMLKVNNYASRVSDKSAVFLTAVMEYITTEILELSFNAAENEGGSRIQPKHINIAMKTDPEFWMNYRNVAIPTATMVPLQLEENEENESQRTPRKQLKSPKSKHGTSKSVATRRHKAVKPRSKVSRRKK